MMARLRELFNKVNQLDMEKLCADVVISKKELVMSLNTDQLFQGQRADGSVLPDYSFVSVTVFGKPNGPIRLYDTGDFYRGFIFTTSKFPLSITSTDEKSKELEQRYGSEIFGLTRENQEELADIYLLPELAKKFLEAIDV